MIDTFKWCIDKTKIALVINMFSVLMNMEISGGI